MCRLGFIAIIVYRQVGSEEGKKKKGGEGSCGGEKREGRKLHCATAFSMQSCAESAYQPYADEYC